MRKWIPKDIKNLRKKYKLSQRALGELLGVSTIYIYLLEKGVKTPSKSFKLLLDCVEEKLKKKER
jgi:DNA-binding transcriptional regulator YiaG